MAKPAVAKDTQHTFMDDKGSFTTIDVPSAAQTDAYGINARGAVVGAYADGKGGEHGFIDENGAFTTIDAPGAHDTYALGINPAAALSARTTLPAISTPTAPSSGSISIAMKSHVVSLRSA